jgi:ATP-dependent Lon protease
MCLSRARCALRTFKYTKCREYYEAEALALDDIIGDRVEVEAFARSVATEFETYSKLSKKVSREVVGAVRQIEDYAKFADTVASRLAVNIVDKQLILEATAVIERLEKLLGLMDAEISVLHLDKRIRTSTGAMVQVGTMSRPAPRLPTEPAQH